MDIVAEPLSQIWKVEIVQGRKFAAQLKLGEHPNYTIVPKTAWPTGGAS